MKKTLCDYCNKEFERRAGHINRSRKIGAPLYCNMKCSGLARRLNKTKAKKVEEKRQYDAAYRLKNIEMIKAKKVKYYAENHDREKEREIRKKRMHLHVKYCQQPEYRAWKKKYDQMYRSSKFFGEFAEAHIALMEVEKEIDSRISRYEIYQANGTINKHKQRRREYEKLISQHT